MNNSMKIVRELDPDGILDKDANSDSFVKRDGEAVDPCHTLSSSESEEEDTADGTEKEMEVDQPAAPILTVPTDPTAILNVASTGSESGEVPDPAPTAAGTAVFSDTAPTPTQSGSGSRSRIDEHEQETDPGVSNSFNRVDPTSKLGKAILQSKFKIPNMPKNSTLEKVPTGVKDPGPKKSVNPIPAEADAIPSKTYTKIISSKMLKGKVGTIGGITSGQGVSECGSFFNKGDNRVLR
jgi:hypothetical protein